MLNAEYIGDLFSLENKVILITGGYGLLGRQFATALANAGARVVIGGRNYDQAKQVAQDIDGLAVVLDVTCKATIDRAVSFVLDAYGSIDGLVNNASYSAPADENSENFTPFESLREEYWRKSLDVDVTGVFFCAQAVGRAMSKNTKGGSIVNVSSIYGNVAPDPRNYRDVLDENQRTFIKPAGYCVAKSAILNFTRYLSVYWREIPIRVNTLSLGGVYDSQNPSFVEAYAKRTPLGRMAKPDEYNGALLFMLSDASAYMTGANLIVDGGWTAW